MMNIVKKPNVDFDEKIIDDIEKKYKIKINKKIIDFLKANAGGIPIKSVISSEDGEHEVRRILSLDNKDKYFCIKKPAAKFLSKTNSKIIPIAVDSGGNYFCVNNENGIVYFWFAEDNLYYEIAKDIKSFCNCFK